MHREQRHREPITRILVLVEGHRHDLQRQIAERNVKLAKDANAKPKSARKKIPVYTPLNENICLDDFAISMIELLCQEVEADQREIAKLIKKHGWGASDISSLEKNLCSIGRKNLILSLSHCIGSEA